MPIELTPIGFVKTSRRDLSDDFWGGVESSITLDPAKFAPDALAGLATFSHVEIIFSLHKIDPDKVLSSAAHPRENPNWPMVGIFAQRKKNRPNRLGLSTCELLKVDGLTITVRRLDAIDGTPVLDIKPCVREFLVDKADVRQPSWMNELMTDYFKDSGSAQ